MANFRTELIAQFARATVQGTHHVDITSGDLHRQVGGYPGPNHRMPVCCGVMRGEMKHGDRILSAPPSGNGATLTIRYRLPRRASESFEGHAEENGARHMVDTGLGRMAGKPTIHELENLLESEEHTPIEILPNGEIRALGGSDAAELGSRKPLTMNEDLGGEYVSWERARMSVARVRLEITEARQYFDYVEAHPTDKEGAGPVMALIALQTSLNIYTLNVFFPKDYPNCIPEVYVRRPELEPSPHRWDSNSKDGQICYMYPGKWNPGQHNLKFVVQRAAKWLAKYEVYQQTGKWPGASWD